CSFRSLGSLFMLSFFSRRRRPLRPTLFPYTTLFRSGRRGGDTAPLAEPLPNLSAVCCGLFLLQQKVELVHEIPGRPSNGSVDGNGVPHRVLDNEHPRLFQVLAQALDVKADQAVGDVHGGAVVEEVQRTVYI